MRTKDLNFAAFLMAKGEILLGSAEDENGKFYFEFGDGAEIATLSGEYYMSKATVNPHHFVIAQKTLKNLIRNYKPYNINDTTQQAISGTVQK